MILSCNNISKSFGTDVIIKSCSFNIEDHEKAAIVGINGVGKSTLLKIITVKNLLIQALSLLLRIRLLVILLSSRTFSLTEAFMMSFFL